MPFHTHSLETHRCNNSMTHIILSVIAPLSIVAGRELLLPWPEAARQWQHYVASHANGICHTSIQLDMKPRQADTLCHDVAPSVCSAAAAPAPPHRARSWKSCVSGSCTPPGRRVSCLPVAARYRWRTATTAHGEQHSSTGHCSGWVGGWELQGASVAACGYNVTHRGHAAQQAWRGATQAQPSPGTQQHNTPPRGGAARVRTSSACGLPHTHPTTMYKAPVLLAVVNW